AGRYRITLRAAGYASTETRVDLEPGTRVEKPFALGRAGLLEGRVVDENGQPVSGATILVAQPADPDLSDEELLRRSWQAMVTQERATTDADGSYRLESFPEGPRDIRITHDDYRPHLERGVEVALGAAAQLDITLRTGLSIRGHVRSASGDHSRFLMCRGIGEENGQVVKTAFADEDGSFRFAGLEEGRYRISSVEGGGNLSSTPKLELDVTEDVDSVELNVE
ncbi:MAG: carboxypeptidase regulatory-like domain-containing protein, partial [Planctomycetes bacterium]|nr:carboxypeptidase regulatory-like domain-containing protein [Planctomycetota bacterium]